MTTRAQLAVLTGRDYVAVATMIQQSRLCGRDRELQIRLERLARRRLELAREDVKDAATGAVWARADIAARCGDVRGAQNYAKSAVDQIKTKETR